MYRRDCRERQAFAAARRRPPPTFAPLLLPQEAVEATAEEASRKLGVNLHDKVGAGPGAPEPPSSTELEAYGITPDYAEFVRTLNYRRVVGRVVLAGLGGQHPQAVMKMCVTYALMHVQLGRRAGGRASHAAVELWPAARPASLIVWCHLPLFLCSTFRDFPAEHLLPASEPGSEVSSSAAAAGGPPYRLNPWQVPSACACLRCLLLAACLPPWPVAMPPPGPLWASTRPRACCSCSAPCLPRLFLTSPPPPPLLQVRHATLVVQALKEVNELRFVLCPK